MNKIGYVYVIVLIYHDEMIFIYSHIFLVW